MPGTPPDNQDSLLKTGLGVHDDIQLDESGRAILTLDVQPHHCHAVAQGGYVTAWIDMAMARAVFATSDEDIGCNTLELKVSFYLPALVGQRLLAEGWVVRKGRSIAFLEGELRDEQGVVLARATSTAKLSHFRDKAAG
ncbi:MAG: PaaI family thioesterase [Pseudomonadales bacterium]|nr:PaaI family thioesterase [Pseudomonadales bacterium]